MSNLLSFKAVSTCCCLVTSHSPLLLAPKYHFHSGHLVQSNGSFGLVPTSSYLPSRQPSAQKPRRLNPTTKHQSQYGPWWMAFLSTRVVLGQQSSRVTIKNEIILLFSKDSFSPKESSPHLCSPFHSLV